MCFKSVFALSINPCSLLRDCPFLPFPLSVYSGDYEPAARTSIHASVSVEEQDDGRKLLRIRVTFGMISFAPCILALASLDV